MTELEEKRDSKRMQPVTRRKVEIYSRHGRVHYTHFGEVVNLSESGICVKLARALSTGEQLQIFLDCQGRDRVLKTEGQIIWKKPAGRYSFHFGVKFITDRRKRHVMQEKLKDIMAVYDARSTILHRLFDK